MSSNDAKNVSPALMKKNNASSKTRRPAERLANYFEAFMKDSQNIIDNYEEIIVAAEEGKDEAIVYAGDVKVETVIFIAKEAIDETTNKMKEAERRFKEELTGLLLESERKN